MVSEKEVLATLAKHLQEVIPEITMADILPENSLKDLGANSMDRAEILMLTMSSLNINKPLISFSRAKNIGDLVKIMAESL